MSNETAATETASMRVKVSTSTERLVRIHDFDGRRVLLSRQAAEPVGSNATYLVIDVECPGLARCALAMVDQPGTAALTRSVDSAGPFTDEVGDLGVCSAELLADDPITAAPDLPEAIQLTRGRMLQLAGGCNMSDLHLFAVESGTALVQSHLYIDGIVGSELLEFPTLATIVALFQEAPAVTADGTHVWPAIADPAIDWVALSDEEAVALAAQYGAGVVADAREFGAFPGLRIEIAADGTWTFYGRPLP